MSDSRNTFPYPPDQLAGCSTPTCTCWTANSTMLTANPSELSTISNWTAARRSRDRPLPHLRRSASPGGDATAALAAGRQDRHRRPATSYRPAHRRASGSNTGYAITSSAASLEGAVQLSELLGLVVLDAAQRVGTVVDVRLTVDGDLDDNPDLPTMFVLVV